MDPEQAAKIIKITLIIGLVSEVYQKYKQLNKRKRRWAVREVNRTRNMYGFFNKTFNVLKTSDEEHFFKAVRMNVSHFNWLLALIQDQLTKSSRALPIEPECRLAVTLMYIAHGYPIQPLAWSFKMGASTIRKIILETCKIVWDQLFPFYLAMPSEREFQNIAINLNKNGKCQTVIVLLAACDAKYCFTALDIGAPGSKSDGGILSKNAAFPLKSNIIRPYPGKNLTEEKQKFNDRLSTARRVIENTFGILSERWRVYTTTMLWQPQNARLMVMATTVFHDFLMLNKDSSYFTEEFVDHYSENELILSNWRNEIVELERYDPSGTNNATREAFALRDKLKNYIINDSLNLEFS